jgi:signal transduction histidine kinase
MFNFIKLNISNAKSEFCMGMNRKPIMMSNFVLSIFQRSCLMLIAACGLLALFGCNGSENVKTPNLVVSQTWHMDKSGLATVADIEKANDWQAMDGWKTWGFGPEIIWVRMHLRAADPGDHTPWTVLIRPSYLDYVTLFDPTTGLVQYSGDALPPNEDRQESINFTFQIKPLTQERDIYLQLRSISSRTLHAQVLPYEAARKQNQLQEQSIWFIIVTSIIFSLWALMQWWISRDLLIGAFAIKQITAVLWSFFIMGFARIMIGPWLPENILNALASTSLLFFISAGTFFMATLLKGYRPWRVGLMACWALSLLLACLPLMQLLGLTREMLIIGNACIILAYTLAILTALTGEQASQPIPLKFLVAYLLVLGTVSCMPPLVHLGWIEAHQLLIFSALLQTFLDGLIMFFMLEIRARALQKEQQKTTLDLHRSLERAEADQLHREEQSQLFAMLAHEMKTPLATLRMWIDAGQLKRDSIERTITDMNKVIELCVHTGQLADQGLKAVWQSTDPTSLTLNCIQACRGPERIDFVAHQHKNLMQTDQQMLSIVLCNLLDNACKYGAADSRIQVSLKRATNDERSGWCWQVNNQVGAAGLPDADRLFEKYYRNPQARRVSGSGLGLFLVKGLLTLLKGSIRYEAQADNATFSIWLPDSGEIC